MARRVAHMVRFTFTWTERAQTHNGVTSTPFDEIYWCGIKRAFLKEEPQTLTPKEQASFDKFVAEQKINPWPVCPKCKAKKDKNKKPTEGGGDESVR